MKSGHKKLLSLCPPILVCILAVLYARVPRILATQWLMWLLPSHLWAQLQGCGSVVQFASNQGTDFQDFVGSLGFHQSAALAMRTFPDDLKVQVYCSAAFESTALFNRKQSLAAAQAGAIYLVAEALRRFPKEREMQLNTAVLSSLNDLAPENRPIVLWAGGIDLIFDAYRNFYNDAEVMFRAGCGISATSADVGVAEALNSQGRIKFMMKIMRDHLKSYRVGQEIMQATRNMIKIHTTHREDLVKAGLVQNVVDTIRAEMHERGTPTIGSTNLALLAYKNRTLQDEIRGLGAMELLLEASQRFSRLDNSGFGGITASGVWPLQPCLCQAFWSLSQDNPEAQAHLMSLEVEKQVIWLLQAYSADRRVQLYGCAVLGNLAQLNRSVIELPDVPSECRSQVLGEGLAEEKLLAELGNY